MSLFSREEREWRAGLAQACERLVHPSVADDTARLRQSRLIGLMLLLPFLYAAAAVQAFAGVLGMAHLLALACALCAAGWLGALLVAATGKTRAAEICVLALGMIVAGCVIAGAGGPASPLALMVLPLAAEPRFLGGGHRFGMVGTAAAAGAIVIGAVGAASVPGWAVDGAYASHWAVPLLYLASLWLRRKIFLAGAPKTEADVHRPPLEEVIGAVVLRMNSAGEVAEVSQRSRDVMQLAPELLAGTGLFDRIHVGDRVAWLTALADLREGATGRKLDLKLRLPAQAGAGGGNYRLFTAELFRAGGDEICCLLRDGSETAALRAELARAVEGARSDEVAKARFLAAVSHELRTPLNSIIGFSDMLLHEIFGGFTDPRQREYAGLIHESGSHLLSVVNAILDVSKIESGAYAIHPEPFRVADAVEMCRAMLAHQAGAKGVALEARTADACGEIRGDRRAVQQILINLVSNAVKFTPAGGRVEFGAKRLGSRLVFRVSDTGIGMADEDLARIGKPFCQIENDYTRRQEGAGLGLSLVKGLVALHDGTLSVESAPGEGTTVTVSLPCAGPAEREVPDARGRLVPLARASGEKTAASDKGIANEALRKTA